MKLTINGKEVSPPETGETLKEILDGVKNEKLEMGRFIDRVVCNGEDVSLEPGEHLNLSASEIETLEIEAPEIRDLILKNLSNAEEYLVKLIPGIKKAAELFQLGNEQEANQYLVHIIDGVDWFSQVVETVIQTKQAQPESVQFDEKSLVERKDQLLVLSAQMLDANKNKDWVHMADLLEYELLPYYQDWAKILPQLKQSLN